MFVKPDLSNLPEFSYGRVFFRIEEDIVKAMQSLNRVLARAHNSAKFTHYSCGDAKLMQCSEDEAKHLREGFLRAALAEFASMEDVLKLDLPVLGISVSPLQLNGTSKSILHFFRELRNHEIHLRQSPLSAKAKDVLWGHSDHPNEAQPLRILVWTLEGVTIESFSELRNAKKYTLQERCRFIEWFNQSQAEWGVQRLLLTAVEEYCREIIKTHLAVGI